MYTDNMSATVRDYLEPPGWEVDKSGDLDCLIPTMAHSVAEEVLHALGFDTYNATFCL